MANKVRRMRMLRATTDAELEQLKADAQLAGEAWAVRLCTKALAGNTKARLSVATMLWEARSEKAQAAERAAGWDPNP